jgi:hypothetical protein
MNPIYYLLPLPLMVEIVIFRVRNLYIGYVRGMVQICACGESVDDVTDQLLNTIDLYDYIQMEITLTEILNEFNIKRSDENDEPTID